MIANVVRGGMFALVIVSGLASLTAAAQDRDDPRGEAGVFDYWVLALSWSPAFCAEADRPPPLQCGQGRRYGFVVHGLWPQYERGSWPQFCNADQRRRDVGRELAETMLPVMPSERLIEHQWDKHGTCTGLGQTGYFAQTVAALERVVVPDRLRAPDDAFRLSVEELERLFAGANPGLTGEGMAVRCRGRFLREVHICLDKDLSFRACGPDVRDTCRGEAQVRPVR